MDETYKVPDAGLYEAMKNVIPARSRSRDDDRDGSYQYDDVRVGRPIYPLSTFTTDPVRSVYEENDYGKRIQRAEADARLRSQDKQREILLSTREEIYGELNKRRQLELDDFNAARRNQILNDSSAFLADFHDKWEQVGEHNLQWGDILELQRKHKSAMRDPQVVDLVDGYKHLEELYNESMARAKSEREATAKTNFDASAVADTLSSRDREVYDRQFYGTPVQGIASVGRAQQYRADYDSLIKAGVSSDVLDQITVGDPNSQEVGFDPRSINNVQADLATIAQAEKLWASNTKRIEDLKTSKKDAATGLSGLSENDFKAINMLSEASNEVLKDRAAAMKRLRGSSPSTDKQTEAEEYVNSLLGNGAQPNVPAQPPGAQPPGAQPAPPNPIREAVGG
jgi:hypothetical protein